MRTHRRLEKTLTAISLVGLALGFSILGLLIVAKEQDGGASITGGILGILLGAGFLIAAGLHWKRCHQIKRGFQAEEFPAAEIVSEMKQAAEAICGF
jgi:Na+/proline symporter